MVATVDFNPSARNGLSHMREGMEYDSSEERRTNYTLAHHFSHAHALLVNSRAVLCSCQKLVEGLNNYHIDKNNSPAARACAHA